MSAFGRVAANASDERCVTPPPVVNVPPKPESASPSVTWPDPAPPALDVNAPVPVTAPETPSVVPPDVRTLAPPCSASAFAIVGPPAVTFTVAGLAPFASVSALPESA